MRASTIMAFAGCAIVSMAACAMFLTGCDQDKQQEQTPTNVTINNDNSVHYENSFNGNTSDYDYNNNEDYDIDNTQDTTNENSMINPPEQQYQEKQRTIQQQEKEKIQQQQKQTSTTASSIKNNINNSTTSTTTKESSNNTNDKGITPRQPEKKEEPVKQANVCEYCGETGKLHGNLRVWMDTNGTDHTTHNKDCTKAYINSTGIQPDSELELD